MGSCASKSQFKSDDLHDYGMEKAADAAVTVYSPHPGSDLQKSTEKPVGVSKDKPSLPYQPETPKNYSIPARRGPPSVSGSTDQRPCPLPISKAPPGVVLSGQWELPYAAPYIPPPSLPPPEYAHLPASRGWQPGRKRAVLVAVNYSSISDERTHLRGCINDIHCLKHLLMTKFGYSPTAIILLHDQQPHEDYFPTKANILAAVEWLVSDCQPQDSLVFAFSGHGTLDDSNAMGQDGILPSDFEEAGPIFRDELFEEMVTPLCTGSRLHCFVDACQGVFALGLPCCVYTRADGWSTWEEHRQGLSGGANAGTWPQNGGEVLMLSSTVADEEDADMDWMDFSQYATTGAVAFSLIQAVEQGQASTYNVLLRAMRYSLKNGPQHFPKVPELSVSQEFDLNRPFLL